MALIELMLASPLGNLGNANNKEAKIYHRMGHIYQIATYKKEWKLLTKRPFPKSRECADVTLA